MQQIFLYAGRGDKKHITDASAMVDDEDYHQLNQHDWYLMKIYHTDNKIYYARRYEGSHARGDFMAILMHRVILGLSNKEDKCDHMDGNGLNNQRQNLRKCNHSQNMSNRRKRNATSSIYFGVYKTKNGNYTYSIKHNGKSHTKRGFVSEDVCANERNKLAIELKGEFAKLNVIRWY